MNSKPQEGALPSVKECAVETIRTAIVLVFLLAILYGAYVVLNQPMPQAPLEVGWNEHSLEPPSLDFSESTETPALDLPDLPPTSMTGGASSEPAMELKFDEPDRNPAEAYDGGGYGEPAGGNRASYDAPIDPNPPVDPPPLLVEEGAGFPDVSMPLNPVPPPADAGPANDNIYDGAALPTFANHDQNDAPEINDQPQFAGPLASPPANQPAPRRQISPVIGTAAIRCGTRWRTASPSLRIRLEARRLPLATRRIRIRMPATRSAASRMHRGLRPTPSPRRRRWPRLPRRR